MELKKLDKKVRSLKVEGRMRSNYYIATVISTYREAIDNYYKRLSDYDYTRQCHIH